MSFFDYSAPLMRCKQIHAGIYSDHELWLIDWQLGPHRVYSNIYTGADQACLAWAIFVFPIFIVGQFLPLDWRIQAISWTVISLIGVLMMLHLAKRWAKKRCVSWLLYCWSSLILMGLIVTNLGIFWGWGRVLINLCSLWLGICAVGYCCTGIALHSRAFIATSLIHWLAILLLPYVSGLQFLFTGTVIVFFLLLLAEFQWDMRIKNPANYHT
jgi:hypothetical protein